MMKYPELKVYFVTGEKTEIIKLKAGEIDARYYMEIQSIPLFLRTHVWVTSHGYNYIPFFGLIRRIIPFYKGKHGSKWIDVWHGLAFKTTGRGEMLKDYDLAIDTSEFFQAYYSKNNSDIAEKIKITGYPRNDPLVDERWSQKELEREFGIIKAGKNILYAPTWQPKRVFPWELTTKFLEEMEKFCEENHCNFLIRMHPNWYRQNIEQKNFLEGDKRVNRVFHVPPYRYADTQPLLFISDVLVTDWSSIANDFILLNRPMIFLDIKFPVKNFVLTPEERAGYVVKNKDEFFAKLYESITHSNLFMEKRREVIKKMYKYIDGNSSKRCIEEILKVLDN